MTDQAVKLNREYYVNKVISEGRFKDGHETIARCETEESAINVAKTKPNLVVVRCDRMMHHDPPSDFWTEEYRVSYLYDRESETWRFLSLHEGLNKTR